MPRVRRKPGSTSQLFNDRLILDLDATHDALGCWAEGQVRGEGLSGLIRLVPGNLEVVLDSDTSDPQNVIHVFDIPLYIGPVSLLGRVDAFSGQHRGQRPHHSGRDGADHMVKGGWVFLPWFDLIKAFDPTVYPIPDLSGESLDNCPPRGTLLTNDATARGMNDFSHFSPPFLVRTLLGLLSLFHEKPTLDAPCGSMGFFTFTRATERFLHNTDIQGVTPEHINLFI